MIATSILQSRRLLELGIKPETADMYYLFIGDIETGKTHYDLLLLDDYLRKRMSSDDVPAWSLSAIINLLPEHLIINAISYELVMTKSSIAYNNSTYGLLCKVDNDDFIDAAVEIISMYVANKVNNKIVDDTQQRTEKPTSRVITIPATQYNDHVEIYIPDWDVKAVGQRVILTQRGAAIKIDNTLEDWRNK